MKTGCLPCFVSLLWLLAAVPSVAQVYKWTDENGRVHYGDNPENNPAMQIDIDDHAHETRVNSGMSREEMRERLLQSMEEDRLQRKEERAEQERIRKRNHRLCLEARDSLHQLDRGTRLYTLDTDGERVYISDTQREKHKQNIQARIREYCR